MGKLFCELWNTLTKASLFISEDSTEFNKNNVNLHSLQYLSSVCIRVECSIVFNVSVKSGDDFFSYFVPMIRKKGNKPIHIISRCNCHGIKSEIFTVKSPRITFSFHLNNVILTSNNWQK